MEFVKVDVQQNLLTQIFRKYVILSS